MNTVVQILDTIADEAARAERTDGQLLDLFVRSRDEHAFATVVRRHGPMVLGVCRRVLGNPTDAEDAFQAAFLVLARRATAIDTRRPLAQWLYGVAYNTARKLRQSNTRRAARISPLAESPEPHAPLPAEHNELLAILDDELSRLPERYRALIVLCDLEGHTRKEVAHQLACPEGTVAGRLARAREMLAARLTARVGAPAAAVFLAALADRTASAASPAMVTNTVRAVAIDNLVRATAKGLISRRVADTTEGVLRAMFLKNVRTVASAALCCGLVLASAAGLFHFTSANAQPTPEPNSPLNRFATTNPPPLPPVVSGPKVLTVIPLRELDCTETAATLTKLFDARTTTITPVPEDKALLVYADTKTTKQVETALAKLGEPGARKTSVFRLDKKADCVETAKTLNEAFGKSRATIVPVPNDHVLLVYATEPDTQTVQKLIAKVLAVEPSAGAESTTRVLTLKNRKAEEVASVIQTLVAPRRLQVIALPAQNQIILVGPPDALETAILLATEMEKLADKLPPVRPDTPSRPDPGVDPHMVLPTKMFSFNVKDVAWSEVLDTYSTLSGLSLVTTVKPTGKFTCTPGDRKFTLTEITDLINEGLMQQKMILVRGKFTFFIHPADERLDAKMIHQIDLNDLGEYGRTEFVQTTIPLRALDAADVKDEIRRLLTPFGVIVFAKGDRIIVCDTAGNVARIAKTLGDIEKATLNAKPFGTPGGADPRKAPANSPGFDPRGGAQPSIDPRTVSPESKPLTFKFKDTPWPEVLATYAAVTGLRANISSKPKGTFTFTPPKTPQTYTLAEITDLLNEALIPEGFLIVRSWNSFTLISADEKVDPLLVRIVTVAELKTCGKTELVRVNVPVERDVNDELIAELKKLIGPFGTISLLKGQVAVQGIASHVTKAVTVLHQLKTEK
ncbi:sigma-70 family rna polymerase sigma factor : RNA polymerase sigma factor, sigma-70 family OS=Singulisphaera acidiphila (strain ATCC BAA-1392 / DSM 18658 / VKM B-2454 / MOB10) GN=Sinac_6419 PE=4 SV=1: Sigma70_r2: Sigma70_r4_2: Secretin_N [Gemmata massiliana]|uniref:ECF RNA polymerase sigma factor SigE n=1 Tax=Gemmata massiliana TaxID=1210884 RepID=A0A6P2D0G5_9BACT|nr:sigma-70 family RNA polymerase sigma factor [Gemmata massiliana]VTR94629.1 sigma-70 family rna polymerase sigma factor : RNA polymerase sigma factor, sigma-70 family OS=Singulisphaera acidiphila (strain ATCC BAA-1392 / DSM 18658 / VKM B-2454 / MOB10) GN=Sinac_6419 PE=4 SV=1: Sigma70_r2: Sigma70_r4_2: Secretin_N [Gemmata massiliana]